MPCNILAGYGSEMNHSIYLLKHTCEANIALNIERILAMCI